MWGWLASSEAARRYYSVKEYLKYGTPNVFSPLPPEADYKFADSDNTWLVHDSSPLQNTIKRYSKDENKNKMSIATSWDKREPRLLVISVDVAEGKTVAFDSYHKKKAEDPENSLCEDDGITIDHVMASGTLPVFYKFREIPMKGGRKFCDGGSLSNTPFRELLQAHRDYWKRV
jgi:predicted acylesterase/phospholipase RssA